MNSKSTSPCRNDNLKRLCSQYSDMLPCCDTVAPMGNKFMDKGKILWTKSNCIDLFELKNELLKSKFFRFKAVGWCMFPALKKGDVLEVRAVCPEDIKIGDIPVYRCQNKLFAHRIVDKQIIDGKEYFLTKPDTSKQNTLKNAEKIPKEDILGKIERVKRGREIFSTQKRKATTRDKLLYKKAIVSSKLTTSLKKKLRVVLVKLQSFNVYKIVAKKLAIMARQHLNFELAIPFFNKRLTQLYRRIALKDNEKTDFSKLKESDFFHLVMKFKNKSIGYATILNRQDCCPHSGFWIGDIYIRLRYREMGFNSILLDKAREVLKETGSNIKSQFAQC